MIEQAMAFALGVALAGLVALAVAPAFWRRALRLSRRRLELTTPLSMEEISAGRDALRARFAVERRALEQAADRLQARRGADMIELGRRAMELAALRESCARLEGEGAAREATIAELRRLLAETQAERAGAHLALHGADELAQARGRELADARAELAALRAQAARLAQGGQARGTAEREENEVLRQALKELGAAVARATQDGAPAGTPTP
ncbi:hypothetical protein [Methylocella sp.]|uniref:hypothetical protein n=1 Tax=Methylocella sp. TaxID=1978226 RepID=UPI003783EB05